MLFPTIQFAVFFAVVLTASWLLAPFPRRWKPFMLAASYTFYGAWDWRFVGLLLASTVINQAAVTAIARRQDERARRTVLALALAANLGILAWFKYYGFFVTSLRNALAAVGLSVPLPVLQIVLPVGISFFTFQAISYVVDTFRGRIQPASPIDAALYLAFFPQLVAGPIVRATEFLPQLRSARDPRHVESTRAFWLITRGLFKKVVVASLLATAIVDDVFANPAAYSSLEILVAIYGYAIQIYADFSGYTDIAIGCALLLGFRFPENFDRPYAARSLQDFWRRWHMTLSRWLRDYLYIPLGGSTGSRWRTTRNLLLTMLLGGLWHGAAWTFVIWGGLHGLGLVLERRMMGRTRAPMPAGRPWWEPARELVPVEPWWLETRRWLITFHVVCLAWVFFRAESLGIALTLLGRLFTAWGPAPAVTGPVVVTIALALAAQFAPRDLGVRLQDGFARLGPAVQGVALAGALLVIDALGPAGVAPFIYFQF